MKMLSPACGLEWSVSPSCKPGSVLNGIFSCCSHSWPCLSCLHSLMLSILSYQSILLRPSEDTQGSAAVQIPSQRKPLILGPFTRFFSVASGAGPGRPLQVLSSLGYKGLTLCLWNDWVSLWSELPFRLMPSWWLSTDQHDRESVAPESGVADLDYQKLRLFTLDFFIQVGTMHLCPEWWERLP